MTPPGLSGFADLGYYPGSNAPRVRHTNRKTKEKESRSVKSDDSWDSKPRIFTIRGVDMEFFTIGMLAAALGRGAQALRKWEREAVIPKATFQAPSDDARGRRRLYTRAQVEGLVKIATEEGLIPSSTKPIRDTKFTERALELFKALAQEFS